LDRGTPYPRVLVVGQSFNHSSGGGITLSNVFEGWPKDRIAGALHSGQAIDNDVCERHYVVGRDEAVWMWPLSLIRRTNTSASGAGAPTPAPAQEGPRPGPSGNAAASLWYRTVDLLGVRDEMRTLRLSEPLRAWIADFAPDVVYSLLGDLPTMALVERIADEFRLPLVVHMMDDWPTTLYRTGALSPLVRRHMDRKLRALLTRASSALAISDAMADEYGRRYGREFIAVHNPVDLTRWDALADQAGPRDARATDEMRLAYAGRVAKANTDSVIDVATVVGQMAAAGDHVAMDIFTGDWQAPDVARLADLAGVDVHPGVPYDRIPSLMREADVMVLPLDFDADSARFARLSMPTKVSEYLASGRPTLTYAPAGSAATEYARSGGWSVVVDTRDTAALRTALERLIASPALREEMGLRARSCAEQNHDALRVREQFRAAIEAAARAPRR